MFFHKNQDKNIKTSTPRISSMVFFLTFADIFTWGTYTIVLTLAALYLANRINHMDVIQMVGVGASIRFIIRAVSQIPIGIWTDKVRKDFDEVFLMGLGITLMSIGVFALTFITQPIHYYIIEVCIGLGSSLNIVTWRKLFAKNLAHDTEGVSYAVYETAMSLSIAILTLVSGIIASKGQDYFDLIIRLAGIIMFISNVWVMMVYMMEKKGLYLSRDGSQPART